MSWDDFLRQMADRYGLSPEQTEVFVLRFNEENKGKTESEVKKLGEKTIGINEAAYKKRMSNVYDNFAQSKQKPNGCADIVYDGPHKFKKLLAWLETKYSEQRAIQEEASPSASAGGIDWREVCRRMLAQRLTSNRLMPSEAMKFDLEDIYVGLALVRLAAPDKRRGDVPAEQGSLLYEPTQRTDTERFEYRRFLSDVLGTKKSDKIAIVGEGGAGKTTLSQKIAFWLLENTGDLAIWVSLGDLQGRSLGDYLREVWLSEAIVGAGEEIRAEWEKQFSERRVWLLLDGLDEMAASRRDALSLRGWLAQSRVVVTCRLNIWQANTGILDGFETYRTLEFQPEQVEKFIENCFRQNRSMGQGLWQALKQPGKERIKDLVRNPLRLMLLCSTWHWREGKLPDTKAELYEQFVETIYQWKKDRFPTTSEGRRQLNAKLGELAVKAIDGEPTRFCLRHRFVCEVLGDPDDAGSPAELGLQLGWLNKVGVDADSPHQPVYAFFHPTFQEYFAACAIADWDFFLNHVPHNPKQGTYRIFELQWKEVILLWLGRDDVGKVRKEEFLKTLVTFDEGEYHFYEFQARFLAAAGIAEFPECSIADLIAAENVSWAFGFFNDELLLPREFARSMTEKARAVMRETERQIIRFFLLLFLIIPNQHIQCHAALILLLEYDSKNQAAIAILTDLLNSPDEWLPGLAALGLLEYDPKNEAAIRTLLSLAQRLGIGQTDDINQLLFWCRTHYGSYAKHAYGIHFSLEGYYTKKTLSGPMISLAQPSVVESSEPNNHEIDSLLEMLRTCPDVGACCKAIYRLRELDKCGSKPEALNSNEIAALIELLSRKTQVCDSLPSLWELLETVVNRLHDFGELIMNRLDSPCYDTTNPVDRLIATVADALIEAVRDCISVQPEFYSLAVYYLGIFGGAKLTAVNVLIEVVHSCRDENTRTNAINSLRNVLRGNLFLLAVTGLKRYLQETPADETARNLREQCYELLGYCAQNMNYAEFYQALNSAPSTVTQSLNLSNLPQLLTGTLANDAQLSKSVNLICIDGSKFIDRHNPAGKIYTEMVKAGCPKCADGTPQTMPILQTYWDLLETDKRIALVFYAKPNAEEPKGFSETFLDALRKFEGAICVVSEQPESRLKSFSPTQPKLV